MKREELATTLEKIRQAAYALHVYLGVGLLEKVYENGLKHRLEKLGLKVEAQKPLKVYDEDGELLGDYFADLVVEDLIVVELKAVKAIANEHYAQILNYLKITGAPAGLLINFGSYKFEVRTVVPRGAMRQQGLEIEPCRSVESVEGGERRFEPCRSVESVEGGERRFEPCRSVESVESTGGCEASTSSTLLHGQETHGPEAPAPTTSSTLLHGQETHGQGTPAPTTSSTLLHG